MVCHKRGWRARPVPQVRPRLNPNVLSCEAYADLLFFSNYTELVEGSDEDATPAVAAPPPPPRPASPEPEPEAASEPQPEASGGLVATAAYEYVSGSNFLLCPELAAMLIERFALDQLRSRRGQRDLVFRG